ncbi:major capsid protein [Microvirus mar42]|nr:major capsid protein [Microvirus mar42]
MSTNVLWINNYNPDSNVTSSAAANYTDLEYTSPRALISALGLAVGCRPLTNYSSIQHYVASPTGNDTLSSTPVLGACWVNADPVLAYYDIIRNYYAFSQVGEVSLALPGSQSMEAFSRGFILPRKGASGDAFLPAASVISPNYTTLTTSRPYWDQYLGRVSGLDEYFEQSFYPKPGATSTYYDRTGQLYGMICRCFGYSSSGVPYSNSEVFGTVITASRKDDLANSRSYSLYSFVANRLPYGVAPSMADRYSRLLANSSAPDVSITNIQTVRQLAIAAKTQAYADLLGAGGSRFTDWVKTFFAADVKHVDRPVLVYASSFYMNSSPIFNQSGSGTLGSYAGTLEAQSAFGKKQQRYCFQEPGYLIDLFSIVPLYYWAGIQKDYARYDKMDYFNPLFNEVGFQTVPFSAVGAANADAITVFGKEPAYNEFRASYDRVFGDLAYIPGLASGSQPNKIYTSWVQQRAPIIDNPDVPLGSGSVAYNQYERFVRFVDIEQTNSCFSSTFEDNFFVNLYYNVSSKSLVSKNFATNLATR